MLIALLLIACDLDASVDTTDSAELVTVASCLADGGSLVELGATDPYGGGLADLEVGADGSLLAMTADGHLLQTRAEDLSAVSDLGAFGTYGAIVDRTGDELLVDATGVQIGQADEPRSDWRPVSNAWGDVAVSPDGAEVTWTYAGCGVDAGVVDMSAGTTSGLDLGESTRYPLAVEYLDDGRLVATTTDGMGTGLAVKAGDTVESYTSLEGYPTWYGVMEALDGEVALPTTASDYVTGQMLRVDVDSGASSAVTLPFSWVTRIAMDPRLVYAMSYDGHVAVTDGADATDLGTFSGAVDIAADPDGAWLAMAGGDGAIHVYGCE